MIAVWSRLFLVLRNEVLNGEIVRVVASRPTVFGGPDEGSDTVFGGLFNSARLDH